MTIGLDSIALASSGKTLSTIAAISENSELIPHVTGATGAALAYEIGVNALHEIGIRGSGTVVGIVDTGVDPQAVRLNAITSWIDLSSEGLVQTSSPMKSSAAGTIAYDGTTWNVVGIKSISGTYRIGFWSRASLPGSSPAMAVLKDIPRIGVLVTDSYLYGQYDTVYIDTNGDGDFRNEKALEVFRNSGAIASLHIGSKPNGVFNILIAGIEDNGKRVQLGFDANGHGTSVASIVVGEGSGYSPVAPLASLVIVKAIDSVGDSSWALITEGVRIACEQGAEVVILGSTPVGTVTDDSVGAFRKVLQQYKHVLVVAAAGNNGPGLGTLAIQGGLGNLLVVGGYVPQVVSNAMGWGSRFFFWPWSSVGPDALGNIPDLLAPAIVPIVQAKWTQSNEPVPVMEGTSASAAYAGGVAALLFDALGSDAQVPQRVKAALRSTAIPLSGVSCAEQGKGMLRAEQALACAKGLPNVLSTRVVFQWNGLFSADAFFDRERVIGQVPATFDNLSVYPLSLVARLPKWIEIPYEAFSVPPIDQKQMIMQLHLDAPGLYSDFVTFDDLDTKGVDAQAAVTAIVPQSLSEGKSEVKSLLSAGGIYRQYVTVPEGVSAFEVSLSIETVRSLPGRARLYVYDRSAKCIHEGAWIGIEANETSDYVKMSLPNAGVWEIIVLCDPALRSRKVDDTYFSLKLSQTGIQALNSVSYPKKTSNGKELGSTIQLKNFGNQFEAKADIIVDGFNGWLKTGEGRLMAGRASTLSIPEVTQGAKALYLGFSASTDPSATLNAYLYWLDPTTSRWHEVASIKSTPESPGWITLLEPSIGRYVAYVDNFGMTKASSTFSWVAFETREIEGFIAKETSTKSPAFTWRSGANRAIMASMPSTASISAAPSYLVVWDKDRPISLVPLRGAISASGPIVNVEQGAIGADSMNVTLRAWAKGTMEPLSACMSLDGKWYQLVDGQARVLLERTSLSGVEVKAEYRGMPITSFTIE